MSAQIRTHYEMGFSTLKTGKRGNRWVTLYAAPYCPLENCEDCGKLGSVTWVKRWWMSFRQPFDKRAAASAYQPEPTLCMACMNKHRPIWNQQRVLDENRRLINRIKREAGRGKN